LPIFVGRGALDKHVPGVPGLWRLDFPMNDVDVG
jgi:hypothetical protein